MINTIEILDCISTYYMQNCAPKNLYEHPIHILTGQQPHGIFGPMTHLNNNNQTS